MIRTLIGLLCAVALATACARRATAVNAPVGRAESGCTSSFLEVSDPPGVVQPVSFALVMGDSAGAGQRAFHLFYTRHLRTAPDDQTEREIGHAVSYDLDTWTVLDTAAIRARPHRLDALHVSSPCVVKSGSTYFMFYAVVDKQGRERIAVARSAELEHWVQEDRPILDPGDVPWAVHAAGAARGRQSRLRDPFVMPDPVTPGAWLLYFVATPAERADGMVVGFARSTGDLRRWRVGPPLWATFRGSGSDEPAQATALASPHVFYRAGAWRLFTTVIHGTQRILPSPPAVNPAHTEVVPPDSVFIVSNATSPVDTATANWDAPRALQFAVPASEGTGYNFWRDTEYLDAGDGTEVLAASSWATGGIVYTFMRPAPLPYLFAGGCPVLPLPPVRRAVFGAPILVAEPGWRATGARLRVELARATRASLDLFDVRGRHVCSLFGGELPRQTTVLSWDGRDTAGRPVGRGVYFACLRTEGGRATARILVFR